MAASLSTFLTKRMVGEKLSADKKSKVFAEIKSLREAHKFPEVIYWSIIFRANAMDAQNTSDSNEAVKKWQQIQTLVNEKNPKVPFVTMGEICLAYGNKQLAATAFRREKRHDLKVKWLIESECWLEATQEIFGNKKHADFEMFLAMLRERGPPFVEDLIRDEERSGGRRK